MAVATSVSSVSSCENSFQCLWRLATGRPRSVSLRVIPLPLTLANSPTSNVEPQELKLDIFSSFRCSKFFFAPSHPPHPKHSPHPQSDHQATPQPRPHTPRPIPHLQNHALHQETLGIGSSSHLTFSHGVPTKPNASTSATASASTAFTTPLSTKGSSVSIKIYG